MNNSGFLFTLMAVLLILSIISLNDSVLRSRSEGQRLFSQAKVLSVNNRFDNINRLAVDFKKGGYANPVNQRILPFSYLIDGNHIRVSQNLPLASGETDGFFNFLNFSKILLEDSSYGNVFDGLSVDVNTVRNSNWGGNAKSLNFLIEPFCYQFSSLDLNKSVFSESFSGKCSEVFDYDKVRRFDVNVSIRNFGEDLNRVLCNGDDDCPNNAFNSSNPLPYYKITIDDSNCGSCFFSQKTIASHFNPLSDLNVAIFCQGSSCRSKSIDFFINKSLSVFRRTDSNYQVLIDLNVMFDSNIEQFLYLDFNVAVKDSEKGIVKTNNPLSIQ